MSADLRTVVTRALQKYVMNPVARRVPAQTVLETTGRKSGALRRTPLGGRLIGDQFWLVSEFGDRSDYVRNIIADPRVRIRLNGRWRSGTAQLLNDDDARARLRELPAVNSMGVRTFGANLLTVRIDLDH